MATALRHSPGRSGGAVSRRRFPGVASSSEPDVTRHWLRIQRRAMACSFEMTLDHTACIRANESVKQKARLAA
jgi:hypothetical protein